MNEIVRRHEVLRTSFVPVRGRAVQRISDSMTLGIPMIDLSAHARERARAIADGLALEESRRPFDLARGPLLRVRLIRLSSENHLVLFTMHHIVSDAWSLGVLAREVAILYGAFSRGLPSPLSELPVQYADFAQWQRALVSSDRMAAQLDYWRRQLLGAPKLNLPTDRPHPAVSTFSGATRTVEFPADLALNLKALATRTGATLFMTLLGGFQLLLHRYSGQDDVVVGIPIAGRVRPEIEGLIGFFINSLVMRTDLSGSLESKIS